MKLVYGVGINDADYVVQLKEELPELNGKRKRKVLWICPFYQRWQNMLKRCYSKVEQAVHPTYKGCTVCTEWLTFSIFKSWMETQDWEDKHLDKDLLGEGDLYSPETCCFILGEVNKLLCDSARIRGSYMVGVSFDKRRNLYYAQMGNAVRVPKGRFIGYFPTELEAHKAWQAKKHEYACQLADLQDDPRVAKALRERYAPDKDWTEV